MQLSKSPLHPKSAAGFTLPAILVVVGALLIIAVASLLVVGIERSTSRAFSDRERANLAARAGLEDVKGIFAKEAANDDFLILQSTLVTPIVKNMQLAPHLFLVRGKAQGTGYSYNWTPLFSTNNIPPPTPLLTPPVLDPLTKKSDESLTENQYLEFAALPHMDKVRASWVAVKDANNKTVGRYAYWVEDLQSQLDPTLVGNENGPLASHTREPWPFPAAGLNPLDASDTELPLNQVALYAVDSTADADKQGDLAKNLLKNRKALVSPNSLLAAAEFKPPLDRLVAADATGNIGELTNLKARAVERSLATGLRTYKEQALIPFAEGIDPSRAGLPKLNLNRLLAMDGNNAVDEMATHIKTALPKFEERKGALPTSEDYLKTLAASAIDYADTDSDATVGSDYRGSDSYPLVSEFLMRFRWDNVVTEGDRKFVVLKVATYVELWNMSDKPVSGSAQMTHDTRYTFQPGVAPEPPTLADMTAASSIPPLSQADGSFWFSPFNISLKPNEYRIITCGEVTYKIDAVESSFFIASPLTLEGETFGNSGAGYKFKWNNKIVDQCRGGVNRNPASLKFPATATGSGAPQAVRANIPGHSYRIDPGPSGSSGFVNNMGDSRMSYYLDVPQDGNSFPANYSPNRRNIRYEIYKNDGPNKTRVEGRVLPSEWPDGGHNSTCENTVGMTETNTQMEPDAARFQLSPTSSLRNPPADEAPVRISNLGRFYSATELGRIFDPILWNVAPPASANLPWGDVLTSSTKDPQRSGGGGNTLRIGRPEHPMFDKAAIPGQEAYHLLDLFHAGLSRSAVQEDREGPVIQIQGHVNINTATRDTLRAIAIGALTMDPKMAKRISEAHSITGLMAPQVRPYTMSAAEISTEADRIADSIILTRKTTPFASPSAIAEVRDSILPTANLVFGNKNLITDGAKVNRTDSAAEEIFARVYEASTVRSRNFRIWVVGQAVAPTTSTTTPLEVLSEVRRVFTVFADPGERTPVGKIDPLKSRLTILHENDF